MMFTTTNTDPYDAKNKVPKTQEHKSFVDAILANNSDHLTNFLELDLFSDFLLRKPAL